MMMFKAKKTKSTVITGVALDVMALLSGCQVGPKYNPPAPAAITAPSYKESTVNFHDQEGWKVASPQDAMIRGKWWEIFNEPELNDLEEQLVVNNMNIRASFENLMAARAVIAEARAQYWPTVTAGASWNRSRSSPIFATLRRPTPDRRQRCGRFLSRFRGRPTFLARFATKCIRRNTALK